MRKGSPPVRVAPLQQNIGSRGPTYLTPYESGLRGRKYQVPISRGTDQQGTHSKGTDPLKSCFAIKGNSS